MNFIEKPGKNIRNILQGKVTHLFSSLPDLTKFKNKIVNDVSRYEQVIWFSDIPNYKGCFSVINPKSSRQKNSAWLEIRKPAEPKKPPIPPQCREWLENINENDPEAEPQLRDEIPININSTMGNESGQDSRGQIFTSEKKKLSDHPEVQKKWNRWKQDVWLPWFETYKQWKQVNDIYFKLFSIHQTIKKLGECYEVVLGLGLLAWKTPNNQVIKRHVIVGNINLDFDADRARFQVLASPKGVKLQFETEMIESSYLPPLEELKQLESMLSIVQESPWEKDEIDKILRSFINTISPLGSYIDSSHPTDKLSKEPVITFTPAIILRQRTQIQQSQQNSATSTSTNKMRLLVNSILSQNSRQKVCQISAMELCRKLKDEAIASQDDSVVNSLRLRILDYLIDCDISDDGFEEVLENRISDPNPTKYFSKLICSDILQAWRVNIGKDTSKEKTPVRPKPIKQGFSP